MEPLTHELSRHYPALRAIRRRRDLLRSDLYRDIRAEIDRVVTAVERGDFRAPDAAPVIQQERLRVVAWNIHRGKRFPALLRSLAEDPVLRAADVVLLSEVDNGLGRSGNHHVARELAQALSMAYAFGVSYLTLEDDYGENPEQQPNTLSLAGQAVLSRLPLGRVENVDLPELRDKFSSSEKRLGKKKALLCEVLLPSGPLLCGTCHLDSTASPRQRAQQLDALLRRAGSYGIERVLVGGDLNTTTYDVSSPLSLLRDLLHKFFVTGFRGTVEGYMTPERTYERPIFATLREHGFQVEGFNDRSRGTIHYDLNSEYAIQKSRRYVGRLLTRLLRYRLRPWNGIVPARLDWFAGRGLQPLGAQVIDARDAEGRPVSDHAAIVVDVPG